MTTEHVDVLIVGAGISGIGNAWHLQKYCPNKSYKIVERRKQLGGTWDLFKYPGIRSDSDMYTLGYRFKPWTHRKAIAESDAILSYLHETVEENGIDKHIEYGRHVTSLNWSSEECLWYVQTVDDESGEEKTFTCSYVSQCSGYYNYDKGYTPEFEGRDRFEGDIIHPQFWPENYDYTDKKVIVIGSGATAFTVVPEMAKKAAHVTMLQRSPTYVASRPAEDGIALGLRKVLPASVVYPIVRWKNVLMQMYFYNMCKKNPEKLKVWLLDQLKKELPEDFDVDKHFTPDYNPWDQRLCAVPDADMFKAISDGSVSVVTDHIDSFTEKGILLKSGEQLEADIIVTATGLVVHNFGGATTYVDGEEVNSGNVLVYKGMMYSDVPNMCVTFGYTNSSWTLKADLTSEYMCRVLNYMDKHGYAASTPRNNQQGAEVEPIVDFDSGYIKRAVDAMPKQGKEKPWKLHQNYALDIFTLRFGKLDDGVMEYSRKPEPAAIAAE